VIGLRPHAMSAGDWTLLAVLQLSLVLLAAFAVWLALRATRPRNGR
jgi:hypothetical protein